MCALRCVDTIRCVDFKNMFFKSGVKRSKGAGTTPLFLSLLKRGLILRYACWMARG